MLPSSVVQVLENYSADLPVWEQCLFITENNKWEDPIVVSKEVNNETGSSKGKIMKIQEGFRIKLETFVDETYVEVK